MKEATRQLAEFCTSLSPESLNAKIIGAVKHRLIDFLGVALCGSTLPSSRIVIELVKSLGGTHESTVLGFGYKVPCPNAALANGSMGHGLELDDVHKEASMHPGVVTIPAAFAMAEREEIDGKSFATSIVLGYEIMTRIGMAVTPAGHYAHGFHPTATCGTFGATVAAGKILGLTTNQLVSAMGIAGSQAAGILEFLSDGSWTKRMHPGWAAHGGLMAALLAQRGYIGPSSVLEGERGFVRSYSDNYDLAKLTEKLGERLEIMNIVVKHHACCYYKQSAIDAALKLVKRCDMRMEDVAEVVVGLVKVAMPIVAEPPEIKYNVKSVVDAQFSMPYGIAVAISKHKASIDEYTQNTINDPSVLSLMEKVKVVHDPKLDEDYPKLWPAKVLIKTKDGKAYEERVNLPKGDPENPFTDEELQERFRSLAGRVLPEDRTREIVRVVWRLEKVSNIRELTELM